MKDRLKFTLYYNSNTFVLADSPDGWDEELLNFERSEKYHGIFRSGSLNLRFVGDGALVLRNAFYTDGVSAAVTMKIEYLNTLNMTYETLISGAEFDFLEFNDQVNFVEVPVIQGGLQRIIDANIDKEVTLTIDNSQVLNYDGVKLYAGTADMQKATWDTGEVDYLHRNIILAQDIISNVDNTQGGYTLYDVNETTNIWLATPNLFRFFKANRDGSVTLTLFTSAGGFAFKPKIYEGDYNGGTEADRWYMVLQLRRWNSSNVQQEIWNVKTISGIPTNHVGAYYVNQFSSSVNWTETIDYNDGDYFTLSFFMYPTTTGQEINALPSAQITGFDNAISVSTTLPLVNINCRTAKELLTLLLAEIEPTATFSSTFLDGLPTNEQPLFVSGDAIRDIANPTIKTSIASIANALSCRYCLGLGVSGTTLMLEEMDYFYSNTLCLNIGEVRNLSVQPASEMYFGSVVVGWPNQEYNELNGRDEFNATQTWKAPNELLENQESRIPSVRADMYGIDFLRITYNGDSSTDTKSDKEVFMVDGELVSTGIYKVSRDKFTSISGLTNAETAYNINYSPKRCLLAWGKIIRSFIQTGNLTLSAYDKNVLLSATSGGVNVTESAPVSAASLDSALFKPVVFSFEFPQTIATFNRINLYPYGYIQFTWNGNTYKGFIKSASIQDARNGILTYTLISHPDTDLTTLIRK